MDAEIGTFWSNATPEGIIIGFVVAMAAIISFWIVLIALNREKRLRIDTQMRARDQEEVKTFLDKESYLNKSEHKKVLPQYRGYSPVREEGTAHTRKPESLQAPSSRTYSDLVAELEHAEQSSPEAEEAKRRLFR